MNKTIDCLPDAFFATFCAKLVSYKLASCSKEARISDGDCGSLDLASERTRGLPLFYLGNYRKSDDGALKRFERTVD